MAAGSSTRTTIPHTGLKKGCLQWSKCAASWPGLGKSVRNNRVSLFVFSYRAVETPNAVTDAFVQPSIRLQQNAVQHAVVAEKLSLFGQHKLLRPGPRNVINGERRERSLFLPRKGAAKTTRYFPSNTWGLNGRARGKKPSVGASFLVRRAARWGHWVAGAGVGAGPTVTVWGAFSQVAKNRPKLLTLHPSVERALSCCLVTYSYHPQLGGWRVRSPITLSGDCGFTTKSTGGGGSFYSTDVGEVQKG